MTAQSPATAEEKLFKHLQDEFERRDNARLQLLSLIAHDLSTPASTVRGYLEMLEHGLAGDVTPKQKKLLKAGLRGMDRLQRMILDMDIFAKLEARRLSLQPESVRLHEVVYDSVTMLYENIQNGQIGLQMRVSEELPAVTADPLRLGQIFTNLISNAIKYSPEGGQIVVHAQDAGKVVQVSVADTGIGIDLDTQRQLFTPFFRADNSAVQSKAGTGVGLVIVKMLVEMHGGEIWVESEPGVGTTMFFTMPIAE